MERDKKAQLHCTTGITLHLTFTSLTSFLSSFLLPPRQVSFSLNGALARESLPQALLLEKLT